MDGFLHPVISTEHNMNQINTTQNPFEADPPIAAGLASAMDGIIIPLLGIFGIFGNLLNLTILTFRYRKREVDTLEKGALLGLINGVIVWKTGVDAFIVTLGAMLGYRGLVFMYNGENPTYHLNWTMVDFAEAEVLGLETPAIMFLIVALIVWLGGVYMAAPGRPRRFGDPP